MGILFIADDHIMHKFYHYPRTCGLILFGVEDRQIVEDVSLFFVPV